MLVELPIQEHTPSSSSPPSSSSHVDILILGAGWTSTFLIPLLQREGIAYAATTRDGRRGTIPFTFDPDSSDPAPYAALPCAATVLITFPLVGKGQSQRLVSLYGTTHSSAKDCSSNQPPRYIQLGVTSIWKGAGWSDENSPYDTSDRRAIAEDELLAIASPAGDDPSGSGGGAAVLSLSGLYGGAREPRHWVDRIARSKQELRRTGALHMIHGVDVARAILATHRHFTSGKRWLLCDLHVYDWWELVQSWAGEALRDGGAEGGGEGSARQKDLLAWVGELMVEEGVRALPRDPSTLGRTLDGRGFWKEMGVWPMQGRVR
ncbi:hypothetical protein SLS62_010026 [Diatrype stigma]|uniref:Uncharacterized protein n=1 Tax=Diatrype stigma TaxID=117547 RepID=A0AAN9UBW0_9PEZI